ncbi:MAG: ABC transporter substrate-binding protein [Paucimonas sp.]|jgi:iron complex transport system substrate-binding protein|nr:ABC transporter substrate-binding protein [Paucimonas sp.]
MKHLTWLLLLACSCAHSLDYRNCGETWTLKTPAPQRILALNQHAADLLLALEAGPALAAVSYIDDDAGALKENRYRGVPLLSRKYPSQEVFYAGRFDLVVGGFASAFRDGVGSRHDLARLGIASYLLEDACATPPASGFAAIEHDLRTLGTLLGRQASAEALIARQHDDLQQARALAARHKPLRVFYLDNQTQGLDSEGSRGFVTELIAVAGGRNLFADIDLHRVTVDAETLLRQDPDVLLLADAVWSPASAKRDYLRKHPALSHLRAVRENHMIDIPFTHLVAGEHSARTALHLARELANISD